MSFDRKLRRRLGRGAGRTLAWSKDEYVSLEPGDLLPTPPPTLEQRMRVAAALLTRMRDEHMCGVAPQINHELVRAILTMSAEAWARDNIGDIPPGYVTALDVEDPKVRFEQTRKHFGN